MRRKKVKDHIRIGRADEKHMDMWSENLSNAIKKADAWYGRQPEGLMRF